MKIYLLRDIDDNLWSKLKGISKQRHFSLRVLILTALGEYLARQAEIGTNDSDMQKDRN